VITTSEDYSYGIKPHPVFVIGDPEIDAKAKTIGFGTS